jgi:hypothetical protein
VKAEDSCYGSSMWRVQARFMAVLVSVSFPSVAQTVPAVPQFRVLILDFKTNRPVAGHRVELLLPCVFEGNRSRRTVRKETIKDGTAVFNLNRPLPPDVCVVEDGMEQRFAISEVLQQGAISYSYDLYARPLSWPSAKQPGELVVYIRRIKAWERFKGALSSFFAGP